MRHHVMWLAVLLLLTGTAQGEVLNLSLKESVVMALEKNNSVRAAGFSAEAAGKNVSIAEAAYYPGLVFEETFAASNAPTQTFMMKLDEGRFTQNDFQISNLNSPSTHHDFKTAITARLPLYNPAIAPTRSMAIKDAEGMKFAHVSSRQETAFEVFRLYLEVQTAVAQLAAVEKGVAEARESMRLARVRNEAGTGLKSDELRARTHLSAAEQRQITAHNNLVIAQMRLAMMVGLEPGSRIVPLDQAPAFAVSGSRESLVSVAFQNRSDMHRLNAEVEKADAASDLARSAYLPAVAGFASYQLNSRDVPFGSDNTSWVAGLALQWQIFDGFRRGHERDRAAAQRAAAAESRNGSAREISFQVQESLLRRDEMGKRLEVARHAVLDAGETVRLLTMRFENSMATMLELLDAQTALDQARADLAATEAGLSLAGGRVYHVTGTFLEEMLK